MATFQTPYTEFRQHNGEEVAVTEYVTQPRENFDAETLPVFNVRFPDGTETTAYPEEVQCGRHGGPWGGDETCEDCTDEDGEPRVS